MRLKPNPRFPHRCEIYRTVGATPFSEGVRETIYDGPCRAYKRNRARVVNGAFRADLNLSIPSVVRAIAGDAIVVNDRVGTTFGTVSDCYAGNLGTTIYWSDVKK